MADNNERWGDPGVTEQLLIHEEPLRCPTALGGVVTVVLQRAGYLKKLRLYLDAVIDQTASGGTAVLSIYGVFGGAIRRIRIEAAGRQPLYVLSGLGAVIYNEIQNRDGGVLAYPNFIAAMGMVEAAPLVEYTADGGGAETHYLKYPLEFGFSLPVFIRGIAEELGLWLLQDRSVDLSIEVEWNPPITIAANYNCPYSDDATLAGTWTIASSAIHIERELYSVPAEPTARPNEAWVHQVVEFEEAISANRFRFDIPAAGLILRAIVIMLDSGGCPIEYTDLLNLSVIYGTNTTPIQRTGTFMVQEFLQDYGRMPAKGVVASDWYKWGLDTLKLAKDSESLANFRIEGEFSTNATGTVKILLDTLQRVVRQG